MRVPTAGPQLLGRFWGYGWRTTSAAILGLIVWGVATPISTALAAVGAEPIAGERPFGKPPAAAILPAVVRMPLDVQPHAIGTASAASIAQWVRDLDDDAYLVRRQAEISLIGLGAPALAAVEPACRSHSAEVRARARRIVVVVRHDQLAAGFRALGEMPDHAVDVEAGMILISQLIDPTTDPAWIRRELDAWAHRVRQRLGDVDPRAASPQQVIDAMCQTLFGPDGFEGASGNFDDPRNSALSHVLKRRAGLPILLSHVAVAIGARLGVPLEGVALPYRYMFKYDGSRAPAGFPKADIIVDAFGGGRVVNEDDLEDIITGLGGGFDPLRHLKNCPRRETLARMLRNVELDFYLERDSLKAFQARFFRRLLEGEGSTQQ